MTTQASSTKKNRICIVAPFGNKPNVEGMIARTYGDILKKSGFNMIEIDAMPILRIKAFFDLIKLRDKYDYIHVHSSGCLADIRLLWSYAISKIFAKRLVITYHCGSPERVIKRTHLITNRFFNSATLITVPSNYSRNVLLKYNPELSKKLRVFPNLIDVSKFRLKDRRIRENKQRSVALTVANIRRWYIYRKGLLTFVRSARYLPEIDFYLVGRYDDSVNILRKEAPENVYFTGPLYDDELVKMYNRADVYCQLSTSESFGVALAEAMACECIPVVSTRASLPEVVGDAGFYVDEVTLENVAQQIKKALDSNLGKRAREQIVSNFSIEKRAGELLTMFERLSENKGLSSSDGCGPDTSR
jgi:glycosyltransferase involved in cell wall biosynthesis